MGQNPILSSIDRINPFSKEFLILSIETFWVLLEEIGILPRVGYIIILYNREDV
jgi:hypothetical protein